jgi:hypothetical protein
MSVLATTMKLYESEIKHADGRRRYLLDKLKWNAEAVEKLAAGYQQAHNRKDKVAVDRFDAQFKKKSAEARDLMAKLFPRNIDMTTGEIKPNDHVTGYDKRTDTQYTPAATILYMIGLAKTGVDRDGKPIEAAATTIIKYKGDAAKAALAKRRFLLHKSADMLSKLFPGKVDLKKIQDAISKLDTVEKLVTYATTVESRLEPVLAPRAKAVKLNQ